MKAFTYASTIILLCLIYFSIPGCKTKETDPVANWISGLSAAGTIGAVVVALMLAKKNKDDVEKLVEQLANQNTTARQHLKFLTHPNIRISKREGDIRVCRLEYENMGSPITINKILSTTHNVTDLTHSTPFPLPTLITFQVTLKRKDETVSDFDFRIEINSPSGFKYLYTLTGTPTSFSLNRFDISTDEID